MSIEFQFEFSPEVQQKREKLLAAIRAVTLESSLETVRAVQNQLKTWLCEHPDDYGMWDAGEPLALLEDALLTTMQTPATLL